MTHDLVGGRSGSDAAMTVIFQTADSNGDLLCMAALSFNNNAALYSYRRHRHAAGRPALHK
jgi:hypothetical protein